MSGITCGQTLHHTGKQNNVEKIKKVFYTARMSVTYQPKKRKRAKTHGFLVRKKTANGKTVLKRRMQKGRARLAVQ
jgi:large subunit ribosomal protein L34